MLHAVAELLRAGWSARAVSAALKVADAGGAPDAAVAAMRAVDLPCSEERLGQLLADAMSADALELRGAE